MLLHAPIYAKFYKLFICTDGPINDSFTHMNDILLAKRTPRLAGDGHQKRILNAVRNAILDGTYPAGCQLPNQVQMARQFEVSGFTVHRALDQLAREGFIRKRRRLGTHVVDVPPHLSNLALVFANNPSSSTHYSKFYQALANAAVAYQHSEERTLYLFHGVSRQNGAQDRQRLIDHLQAHQLAGIIFSSPPLELQGTPILDLPGVPRVAFAATQPYPHVPSVTTDRKSFLDKALDYLVARGRRRIALLMVPGFFAEDDPYLAEALAKRNIQSPPHWQLTLGQSAAKGAANCVRLLMHGNPAERPDGLVVFDDNLVEHVQAGLIAAGVQVPDSLEVVEHCNFPWPPSVLSTRRLGYDVHGLLRVCIDLIDRQRRGEQVSGLTKVSALFEEELPTTGYSRNPAEQ